MKLSAKTHGITQGSHNMTNNKTPYTVGLQTCPHFTPNISDTHNTNCQYYKFSYFPRFSRLVLSKHKVPQNKTLPHLTCSAFPVLIYLPFLIQLWLFNDSFISAWLTASHDKVISAWWSGQHAVWWCSQHNLKYYPGMPVAMQENHEKPSLDGQSLVQDLYLGPVANPDGKCCIVYPSARPNLQIGIHYCQSHLEYDTVMPTTLPSCPFTDGRTDCKNQLLIMEIMVS